MKRAWWGGCCPSQLLMSLCLCGTGGVQGSGCWRPWGRRWREVHRPASFLQRAAATTHDVASSPEVSSRPTLEIRAPHVTCEHKNNAHFYFRHRQSHSPACEMRANRGRVSQCDFILVLAENDDDDIACLLVSLVCQQRLMNGNAILPLVKHTFYAMPVSCCVHSLFLPKHFFLLEKSILRWMKHCESTNFYRSVKTVCAIFNTLCKQQKRCYWKTLQILQIVLLAMELWYVSNVCG